MIFNWIAGKRLDAAKNELERAKGEFQALLRERECIASELRSTKDQLADVKLKKKIEEEDIKHLTKIKLEHSEIEYQKKLMVAEKEKDAAIMSLKQDYADKFQVRLEQEVKNIREMYSEILKRIPDVSVRLKGEA